MIGAFPIAGAPIAASVSAAVSANLATGTGDGTGTAAGVVVGTATGLGAETSSAAGRVIGLALGTGNEIAVVTPIPVQGTGSEVVTVVGDVQGRAAGTGSDVVTAPNGAVVGRVVGTGESQTTVVAFYPLYTAWESEAELFHFSGPDVNEVDAAFEQAGRLVVCSERTVQEKPEIWLYWFNPTLNRFAFEKKANGRNPRCILDDPFDSTNSDVLVFYVRTPDQRICYRQQRDRYDIEYETPVAAVPFSYVDLYLQDVVKDRSGRIVVIYAWHDIQLGTWSYGRLESALYPLTTDVDSYTTNASLFLNTSIFKRVLLSVHTFGETPPTVPDAWLDADAYTATASQFVSGLIQQPIREVGPPGSLDGAGNPVPYYDDVETYKIVNASFQSGTLFQVIHDVSTFDIDQYTGAIAFQSGILVRVVIDVVLFDIDQYTAAATFLAAGSSLA